MIDYIVRFFNGDWFDIAGKVIAILFVTLLLYVCFNYARRRRLVRVIVIDCLLVAVSFVLCVLQVDNFQFFVYLTISLIALINVLFFSDDFKHDLFKGGRGNARQETLLFPRMRRTAISCTTQPTK